MACHLLTHFHAISSPGAIRPQPLSQCKGLGEPSKGHMLRGAGSYFRALAAFLLF